MGLCSCLLSAYALAPPYLVLKYTRCYQIGFTGTAESRSTPLSPYAVGCRVLTLDNVLPARAPRYQKWSFQRTRWRTCGGFRRRR
eukprot:3513362-Rhodomonas_salina.5